MAFGLEQSSGSSSRIRRERSRSRSTELAHVLRAPLTSDGPVTPEVWFTVDRPERVVADLRRTGSDLQLDFARPEARAARLARVMQSDAVPAWSGAHMRDAAMLRALSDSAAARSLGADQARAVFESVDPSSPLWLASGDAFLVLRAASAVGTSEPAALDYLERYLRGQIDPAPLHNVVYTALGWAHQAGDTLHAERMLDLVRTRDLADSYWGSRALAEYGANRTIRSGQPVPAFELPTLDGSTTITSDELLGTVYLLDFWAMWCGPCVAERDELAALYREHHARGLEIVSVSMDFSPEDVDRDRWPMPWRHAYVGAEGELAEAVRAAFTLESLPKLVLAGADGRVIAGGAELRPETVSRLLPDVLR
jgi:thiol-disulfide isomerase/thioredoxin